MKSVPDLATSYRPETVSAPIDLELILIMAALFRANAHLRDSGLAQMSQIQTWLATATDSGISTLLNILLLQVLMLTTSALIVAIIIG